MTNIYGIEPESAGWLEQESPDMPTCPQCHSDAEVYVTNKTIATTEYTCATCGIVFYSMTAIPIGEEGVAK